MHSQHVWTKLQENKKKQQKKNPHKICKSRHENISGCIELEAADSNCPVQMEIQL